MPFVTQDKRAKIDALTDDEVRDILFTYKATAAGFTCGDRTYYFYKKMMNKWVTNRRWTTAHNIYATMISCQNQNYMDEDTKRAYSLAWQVFFNLHVLKYEAEKIIENGDIVGEVQQEDK